MAAAAGSGLVALAATPTAHDEGWGPKLAAEIGRRWAAEGLSVRLLDLCLADPKLEGALGLQHAEGASDAILFGASLGRVLRPAGGLQFVSAGTPVTQVQHILESDGMTHLARRLLERDGVSLLYVSIGSEGAASVLSRADQVILMAEERHGAEAALGTASVKTVAVVGPVGDGPGERADGVPAWSGTPLPAAPPLAPDALRNAEPDPFDLPVEVQVPGRSRDLAPSMSSRNPPVVEEVLLPAPPPSTNSRRGPLAVVGLLLILVLLAIAIQMGWIGAPSSFRSG